MADNTTTAVNLELWRSPEEWADTPEFRQMLTQEFPDDVEVWTDPVSRRHFLSIMGASLALAGVNGCSPRPMSPQKILPYTTQPQGMVLGVPNQFSSAIMLNGVAAGVRVTSHEGRPTKIEGNPLHPGSLGSTDVFSQAAILELYDPDRSQALLHVGAPSSWDIATSTFKGDLEKLKAGKPANIRILSGTVTSPTLAEQIGKFSTRYGAKWIQYEPISRDDVSAGARLAFGTDLTPIYDFTKADIVVALDSDFQTAGPGAVRYSRDFASRRKIREAKSDGVSATEMSRLYSVEPMLTSTGAVADHRLPLKAIDIENFTRALAKKLDVAGTPAASALSEYATKWLDGLAKDLESRKGKSIVVAGDHQPAAVHALVHAINAHLGNLGQTVSLIEPIEAKPSEQLKDLAGLVNEMGEGKVDLLFIIESNPVFDAPVELKFAEALDKVGQRVHLGLYQDETAARCHWHINAAHTLETWGDARAYDGTVTIQQPGIAPLYDGHSALELFTNLSAAPGQDVQSALGVLKEYWAAKAGASDFELFWFEAVEKGVVPNTAAKKVDRNAVAGEWAKSAGPAVTSTGTEICFRADPTIYDGRFANLGWLQELPKPVSKICWENAALMSPKMAERLGIHAWPRWTAGERGRMEIEYVELTFKGRKLKVAAWPVPGHVDDSITLYTGYGRTKSGRVGNGTGYNAYELRTSDAFYSAGGLEIKKLDETLNVACTQAHHSMEGRKPVRITNARTMAEMKIKVAEGDEKAKETRKKAKAAFLKAMEPPVAAGEYELIKANVPGPHNNAIQPKKDDHDHKHDHDHDEEHHHAHDPRVVPLTMYPAMNNEGRRWAMAIDLSACTGCNVCMIACQAENNIPVIGKFEVTRGREMHWIRVDRYQSGAPDDAEAIATYFQPVPCQQCEKAPCEIVCPVGATVHSTDGLNDMVYNRCVGTRYCSNNCPYKVRRFNFLTYSDYITQSLKLGRNPEVTVRTRGVMEKCTYCVQRIRSAEIVAEREWSTRKKDPSGRPLIADGEIITACQAACPSQAIVFGDLSDTVTERTVINPATGAEHKVIGSEVNRWKTEPTNYALLAELNTMPRTTYLATVRNPNPDMPSKGA